MIRKTILVSLLSAFSLNAIAQSVGINTETPNKSAVLDISPFQGETAKIEAKINNKGNLSGFTIIHPGYGYQTAPEVIIAGGGPSVTRGGVRATATAEIDNQGRITKINLTNPGSEYYTTPEITLINKESMGWALPRVDLANTEDNNSPIKITDEGADGLLVYNAGDNQNPNAAFWYDKNNKKWYEGVTANKTPKISIFELTANEDAHNMNGAAGSLFPIITNPLFKEPISNIHGVETTQHNWEAMVGFPFNTYPISLPKIRTTYIIEVNLNLNTDSHSNDYAYNSTNTCDITFGTNCSKAINREGYQIMGYFLEIWVDNAETEYSKSGQRIRKEVPILAKIGSPHKATWLISLDVEPDNSGKDPLVHFLLGRMDGSTHHQPVKILADGSFIKVQQIN